jgi:Nucleoside-diphosphate-sugar pyrophosphorylase involved in lipopolysaccharide biosynthesis/translation initiation factor 2B, gamma/epsilon subunits (eIF-2Bgamma/eIF-2Bepsilon)
LHDFEIKEALVLCAGKGKEMGPLTKGVPKHLFSLLGKTVFERILENLKLAGIERVAVVVAKDDEKTPLFAQEVAQRLGMSVESVEQNEKEEVLGAVLSAKRIIEEWTENRSFVLAYGDIVASSGFYRSLLVNALETSYPTLSAVLQKDTETFGVIKLGSDGFVERIIEKPTRLDETLGGYVLAGAFVLPTAFFELALSSEDFITALNALARSHSLSVAIWNGAWADLGYPWDILNAAKRLLEEVKSSSISSKAKISPTAIIEPPVIIEEGAVIDHNAVVKGPVYIGRNAYVGTGALIHSYASIEEGVTIGAYSEVNGSVLQPYSSIGRGCFVGNTVAGYRAIFEPHVVTLNLLTTENEPTRLEPVIKNGKRLTKIGSVVGNRARIGANTVLQPLAFVESGAIIPPNSVIQGAYR